MLAFYEAYKQKIEEWLTVSMTKEASILDMALNIVYRARPNQTYDFSLATATAKNERVFLATSGFGILETGILWL